MAIVDAQRFGVFQYGVFSDVNDSRIERHLPTNARNITLEKRATGHRAKYSISESDLKEYLDGQWAQHGNRSSIPRAELREGAPVAREQFDLRYGDLGWLPLENAVEFHSPVASDGSGATYFFDARIGTAYHHAGYW